MGHSFQTYLQRKEAKVTSAGPVAPQAAGADLSAPFPPASSSLCFSDLILTAFPKCDCVLS